VIAQPAGVDLVEETSRQWDAIVARCSELTKPVPSVPPELAIDALVALRHRFETKIEEILNMAPGANSEESNPRVDEYAVMIRNDQAVAHEMEQIGVKMATSIDRLNGELDEPIRARIQDQVARRAAAGYLGRNGLDRANQCSKTARSQILGALVPNLAVQQDVARVEPATLQQVEETEKLLSAPFTLSAADPDAALHIMAGIAKSREMRFARIPAPPPAVMRDAWNKSADFAMENDLLTEASLHLLGSDCPEHQVKGISLHLQGDLSELEADESAMERFIVETKAKLAAIHHMEPSGIVIVALTPGSIDATYALARESEALVNLELLYQKYFGPQYLSHEIHPSFSQLNIDPSAFDVRWNADFRVAGRCPVGESRGGQPYHAPAGYIRYGLNVAGKFDNGNDLWLGMKNGPGEWCVSYHGTKPDKVKPIIETPLKAGAGDVYGCGIYCSPNPAEAAQYTDYITSTTSQGTVKLRYMFMCRVNPRSIHHCTQTPCLEARNANYTLHFTQRHDYWFVNCENQSYQNIRPYGLLVREQ
jgi:hypothetical protein